MKKRTCKLLSALICFAMLLTLLPATALAEGTAGEMPVFTYTEGAEITRLNSMYDGCPLIIWRGYIQVTKNGVTTKLNAASDELLARLRPVWKDKATGNVVEPDSDVTIASTDKYYVGPATTGTYTFTLQYNAGENGQEVWVDTQLPAKEATIGTVTMERVTDRSMFSSSREYAIVGEGENGQLYAMSMHADTGDIDEAAAIAIAQDGDGHITLGNEPALIFQPYHYLNTQRHYPRGDTAPETLLWDLGTGIFGRYQIQGYTREGSVFVSGDEVGRYGGLVTGDGGTMLTFADGGAVTMYAPFMGHSEKYLRLVQNADGSYAFTSKTATTDSRASYPVYLYRNYVYEPPTATETKFEYIGPALDKAADGLPVKVELSKIITTMAGSYVEEQPLDETGLYGKYVTGVWYKIEGSESTVITGGEIVDEETFALTGPSEPGTYRFVLQEMVYEPGVTANVYLTIDFTIAPAGVHVHTWDNGTVTEATCTTDGVKTYTCTACGATKTETIPATGHDVGTGWQYDVLQHWKVCNNCGAYVEEAAHTMGDWEADASVTNGQRRTCSVCGYLERMVANAPGQTSVEIPGTVFSAISNEDPLGGSSGATVTVGEASVTYSAAAVEVIDIAVNTAAGADAVSTSQVSVTLTVDEVEDPTTGSGAHQMNDAQQAAVETAAESAADVTVYSITLEVTTGTGETATTTEISDFGDGTATVTVPYHEPVGEGETVSVVRVETNGTTTEMPSDYDADDQTVTWTTGSHSFYMITSGTASAPDPTPMPDPIPDPGTGGGYVPVTNGVTAEKAEHGSVTVSPVNAAAGTTVTVTVAPDKGYTLETLTVTDAGGREVALTAQGDGKYTFKMPSSKVTVKATFMEDNTMLNFFTDVQADDYFYDAILWAAKNGITDGTSATTFSPNADCTRGQIVTFLWRAAECPAPKSSENPFTDVSSGAYYYDAMLWAVENGITNGTGDGTTFSPNLTCTRDQAVTFLWRSAGKSAAAADMAFTDVSADAYYAPAVQWAVTNGITTGTGDGSTFSPADACTRGQIVAFLYRWLVE